jgi:hypothetical protein
MTPWTLDVSFEKRSIPIVYIYYRTYPLGLEHRNFHNHTLSCLFSITFCQPNHNYTLPYLFSYILPTQPQLCSPWHCSHLRSYNSLLPCRLTITTNLRNSISPPWPGPMQRASMGTLSKLGHQTSPGLELYKERIDLPFLSLGRLENITSESPRPMRSNRSRLLLNTIYLCNIDWIIYQWEPCFANTIDYDCEFCDQTGDCYEKNIFASGYHCVDYNSANRTIILVTGG